MSLIKKIESLTQEQIDLMPFYRDKWMAIGLSTRPSDRLKAEEGIELAYKIKGLDKPKVVWCVGASVGDSVWDSVGDSVYGQHDANWLGYYDYFNNVLKLEGQTRDLAGLWMVS